MFPILRGLLITGLLAIVGTFLAFSYFWTPSFIGENFVHFYLNKTSYNSTSESFSLLNYFRRRETRGPCRLYFEFGGRMVRRLFDNNVTFVLMDGQKAICMDSGLAPPSGLCAIYSFGLSEQDRFFDLQMEAFGCDIYAFDPSYNLNLSILNSNRSRHIHHFDFELGINTTHQPGKGLRMATLAHIRQYLQHNYLNLDYLKLDIGGNEWLVLDHLIRSPILGKIKQIGAKLHLGTEENEISEDDDRLNIIRKLEEKGFVRFFARRIFGLTGKEFIFEVAWFNANYSQPPSDGWSDKAINDDVFLNEIQPFHSFSQP